jgi:hypothetical protein
MVKPLIATLILAGLLLTSYAGGEPITTGSLISQMIDMKRLVEFPDPAYKTIQFSSYDHRSTLPGGPMWFANSDGFGREPVPNFEGVVRQPDDKGVGEYLICDVEGPGAIVRTWSARMEGVIRVYLDGSETPLFDGPAEQFLMRTYQPYASAAGIDEGLFAGTFFQRNAAYCPIPFAKHCRIVWIGGLKTTHFYQVQVRLYDKCAEVVTFRLEDLKTYEPELRRVARILTDPDGAWEYSSKEKAAEFAVMVQPGAKAAALELPGPGAVERFAVVVKAADRDAALRQTVMRVICDEYPWGQVQSPVGDFFGSAPGINPYVSIPFTVAPDGTMTCRYVMPFEKSFKLAFENRGDQPVEITGTVLPMPYAWNPDRSMHFRARWQVNHDLVASNMDVQDLPFLIANGTGVYVGTAVMLLNPNPVPSSGGNWWGEGDEKVFVDVDVRPSTFGTGSEDYFNYAWSSTDIFSFPYCGQTRNDGPANRGFVANGRWQIVDALPFQQRIAFYMELFSHERTEHFSYARIGYHYAQPGLMDDHVAITDEDVRKQELPLGWEPAARGGARNSVFYQAENVVNSRKHTRVEEGRLWAGGKLCRWNPSNQGEELTFTVAAKENGMYNVAFCFARDARSGRVSLLVDGKKAELGAESGIVDLHEPHRTMLRMEGVKPMSLAAGEHALTLRFEGAHEGAKEAAIGIDFISLQRR